MARIIKYPTWHGYSKNGSPRKTKLYAVWAAMKERCNSPKNKRFANYGGRGILVCKEWMIDFQSFARWALDNSYREGLFLDRIDNNKGYSPKNCRFVTVRVSNMNTSRTKNGCFFDKRYNNYRAEIFFQGKKIYLGAYKTKEEGERVYIEAFKMIERGIRPRRADIITAMRGDK